MRRQREQVRSRVIRRDVRLESGPDDPVFYAKAGRLAAQISFFRSITDQHETMTRQTGHVLQQRNRAQQIGVTFFPRHAPHRQHDQLIAQPKFFF